MTPRVTFQSGERPRGSLPLGSLLGRLEIGSQDCWRFLSCLGTQAGYYAGSFGDCQLAGLFI